jgi:DNA-binding NarL/FixJ family response regulator
MQCRMRFVGGVVGMLVVGTMGGCGTDHSDQIVDLQKQIALLSRQVEETRKDLHILQETDKNLKQSLDATDAELSRLAALESLPSTVAKESAEEVILPTAADHLPPDRALPMREQKPKSVAASKIPAPVSCAQVWELLGKGKSVTQVARTLNTTPERVKSCERQVGRGKGQKTRSEFDS